MRKAELSLRFAAVALLTLSLPAQAQDESDAPPVEEAPTAETPPPAEEAPTAETPPPAEGAPPEGTPPSAEGAPPEGTPPPAEGESAGGQGAKPDGLTEAELKALEGELNAKVGVGPEVFDDGVKLYYKGSYADAANRLYQYLGGNQPGAEKYGYAEFFLASCLDKLGFFHAAAEYYYNVAKNRTKPELLPDALENLERITREHPFDQELILYDLIYDTTFGYLRSDLQEFAEFYQGLLDYRNGFIRWGNLHFGAIQPGTYYYFKSRYVEAVYELVLGELDRALALFQEILSSEIDQVDAVNSTRQSVARILFEQKRYQEAYDMYERINAPIEHQASVFLEEAWSQYYLKDYRRTMGLLYALEAPAFYRYFNPEKFVLKALIYKNLCHYNVAKNVAAEFFDQYGEAIRAIYDRVDLERNEVLREAALQDPTLIDLSKFQRLLDSEATKVERRSDFGPSGLQAQLKRIYGLKQMAVKRKVKILLEASIRRVADKLLEYEEQINLLDYEIGLAMYKRIHGAPKQKEVVAESIPWGGEITYYAFDGEFWNDEMHDFRFFIEDRCFNEERWE